MRGTSHGNFHAPDTVVVRPAQPCIVMKLFELCIALERGRLIRYDTSVMTNAIVAQMCKSLVHAPPIVQDKLTPSIQSGSMCALILYCYALVVPVGFWTQLGWHCIVQAAAPKASALRMLYACCTQHQPCNIMYALYCAPSSFATPCTPCRSFNVCQRKDTD
jgi:hypothetical protein